MIDLKFDEYLKKEAKLPFDTITFNVTGVNLVPFRELMVKLEEEYRFELGLRCYNVFLNSNDHDSLIIVLHTAKITQNRLNIGRMYTTNGSYINNNFADDYRELNIREFEDLDSLIKLFDDLLINDPTYKPRKFVH